MKLAERAWARRARRAVERQLAYQEKRAAAFRGHEAHLMGQILAHAADVRARLEAFGLIAADARILEVGCGAHGLIFGWGKADTTGVDPLAHEYARLFPAWQNKARVVAGCGEALPFADASFDIVLCDNVVDHAEGPARIVAELARVLRPEGRLYFTVNVHHPAYHWASRAYGAWRALGGPFEVPAFADHTVHFSPAAARRLFDGLPLRMLRESDTVEETRRTGAKDERRRLDRAVKRLFFKNARYEAIAVREA